ncbi:hypothetical protein EV176_003958 [Coemansia sp. RSA 451]|nr:hypothetical protein EV176_003958 [Coemansia sp. RSA 451]
MKVVPVASPEHEECKRAKYGCCLAWYEYWIDWSLSENSRCPRATRLSIPAPVAWPQFKQLVDAKDLQPLGRSFPMQITYEQHKVRMERRFGSIATYLTNHVLADLIAETNAPGFDPHAPLKVSDFVFRANDFPYFLGDDVEHWVMWCKKRLEPGFEPPTPAIDAIEARFGCSVEWRYFVNPVHRQSVPQLSHAHVFIKRT